jgi:hypothetical protein
MQDGAADSERISLGERGFDGNIAVYESNAAEGLAGRPIPLNSEPTQRGQAVGHQSFAAYFIDRRARAIGECDIQPFAARRDSGRDPGRSTANNEYVSGLQNLHTAGRANGFRQGLLPCAKQS